MPWLSPLDLYRQLVVEQRLTKNRYGFIAPAIWRAASAASRRAASGSPTRIPQRRLLEPASQHHREYKDVRSRRRTVMGIITLTPASFAQPRATRRCAAHKLEQFAEERTTCCRQAGAGGQRRPQLRTQAGDGGSAAVAQESHGLPGARACDHPDDLHAAMGKELVRGEPVRTLPPSGRLEDATSMLRLGPDIGEHQDGGCCSTCEGQRAVPAPHRDAAAGLPGTFIERW